MTKVLKKAKQRVQRGANLLDDKMPNWREQTDRGRLAKAGCILADLYGSYSAGRVALDLNKKQSKRHGFSHSKKVEWSDLEPFWQDQIKPPVPKAVKKPIKKVR